MWAMAIEVFPVVHVREASQAVEQAQVAHEAGAAGVYLIDHITPGEPKVLLDTFNTVSDALPDTFIGLNFLASPSPAYSFALARDVLGAKNLRRLPDAIWADDADRELAQGDPVKYLRDHFPELRGVRYLGGVAFKGTRHSTAHPVHAAAEARRLKDYVDVVTTSGPGTGIPPSPEKIRAMKVTIGQQQLAVASGISIENIEDFAGAFDQLLVATSIETEPYSGVFVPRRVEELVERAATL